MDAIGVRLATIPGLRVYDHPADTVAPPAAIVSLPEIVEYDSVAGRGADRTSLTITVIVGRVSDRAARDQLAAFISGTGPSSIKTAVEAGASDLDGVAHTIRATTATVQIVTINAIDYLGASIDCEVYD